MAEIECEREVDRVIEVSNLSFNSMNIILSTLYPEMKSTSENASRGFNDLGKPSDEIGFDLLYS